MLQTNLGAVRGLLEPHEIEFSVDGTRVFQATVGGDADNAMSAANAAAIIKALDARLTARVADHRRPARRGGRLRQADVGAGRLQAAASFCGRRSMPGITPGCPMSRA